MATRIRLSKVGRKKQASFRIVVAGSMHARGGRVSETIGKYNPRTYPSYIEIDEVRALYWLKQGAQMSESVEPLFRKAGILKKHADSEEGAGVVTIGDGRGKTILADRPGTVSRKAQAKAEASAAEAAKTEAAAESKAEVAAESKAEVAAEAEAAAEPEAEAKAKPKAKAEAEPEAEAAAKPKAKAGAKPKAKAGAKAKAKAAKPKAEAEDEGAEAESEEEKQDKE
jgi:small subunit ribosomal protein S16